MMSLDFSLPVSDQFVFHLKNIHRIADELKDEADRGVVLVVAAFLEEQLGQLLRGHFIDDAKVVTQLLSNNGALATFSSRAKLAYCLDLIGREHYSDLETIRRLRNEFAHSHVPVTFDSDRVRDLCASLAFLDLVPNLRDVVEQLGMFQHPNTTRERFIMHALALFGGLAIRAGMSECGIIDATRFMERDTRATGGEYFQILVDEFVA